MNLFLQKRLLISFALASPYILLLSLIYFLKKDSLATELAILSSGLLAILFTCLTGLILAFVLHSLKLKNLTFILKHILMNLLIAGILTIVFVNFYPVNILLFLLIAVYLIANHFNEWIKKDLEDVRLEPVAFLAVGFKVLIFILLIF